MPRCWRRRASCRTARRSTASTASSTCSSARQPKALPLGQPFELVQSGIIFKPYPSGAPTHAAVHAALALHGRLRDRLHEVAGIVCLVHPWNFMTLREGVPADTLRARVSMRYCVAAALRFGALGSPQFTDAALGDPLVQKFMTLIEIRQADDLPDNGLFPAAVEVRLADGHSDRVRCDIPPGAPAMPMSEAEADREIPQLRRRRARRAGDRAHARHDPGHRPSRRCRRALRRARGRRAAMIPHDSSARRASPGGRPAAASRGGAGGRVAGAPGPHDHTVRAGRRRRHRRAHLRRGARQGARPAGRGRQQGRRGRPHGDRGRRTRRGRRLHPAADLAGHDGVQHRPLQGAGLRSAEGPRAGQPSPAPSPTCWSSRPPIRPRPSPT